MPLKIQFTDLYEISENQQDLVSDVWDEDEWDLSFRRNLQGSLIEDWTALQQILENIQFDSNKEDSKQIQSFHYQISLSGTYPWGG
jgi:hypothetical protein